MPAPRKNPLTQKIEFHLSEIEAEVLDEAITQHETSRSAFIREAVLQRLEREGWISRDVTITKRFDLETGETTNKIRMNFSNTHPPEEDTPCH